MKMENRKILVLGATGFERTMDGIRVDCVAWEKLARLQNIRDYHQLIVDLLPLATEEARTRVDWERFRDLFSFSATTDILTHEGSIVVVGDPRFAIPVAGSEKGWPFLFWTGANFIWDEQPGDTVVSDTRYGAYSEIRKYLRNWNYSLASCRPNDAEWESQWSMHQLGRRGFVHGVLVGKICVNRYQHALICAVTPYLNKQYEEPPAIYHPISFVPEIALSEDETLQLVLRDLCGVATELPEPPWLARFVAPGQQKVDEEIAQVEQVVREANVALSKAVSVRSEIRSCLKLLYEREYALEPAVRKILASLGASVEEPKEKNKEDGWITVSAGGAILEGVLEIKSAKGVQFGEEGRKQVLDWVDRGRTMRGKNYKGIFIGNSAVATPVEQRGNPFSDSWRKAAELSSICAVTSTDLYQAYVMHCDGVLRIDDFWRALFSTNGVFNVSGFLPQLDAGAETK